MNSSAGARIVAVTVLFTLATTSQLSAQQVRYKLIDFGTFGGPQSYLNIPDYGYARIMNNSGMVAGWADTRKPDRYTFCFNSDCFVSRSFRWQDGSRIKLNGLAMGLSSAATWIAPNGLVAGLAQNGQLDPSFPGFPVTHGVLWRDGIVTDLGIIDGGFESAALAVNSKGQVVGGADNGIPDATPLNSFYYGWATETRAFLWQDGIMQDLHTLGGKDAVAFLINETGQVAGISYVDSRPSEYCANNVGPALTTGAFLWENGKMENLGNFGGTCTFAFNLNNRGQVIGASTLKGDEEQHPFLWDQGTLTDLGTFGGSFGNAISLNEDGKVVGFASLPGDQIYHAALWTEGRMTDLGTLAGDTNSFAFDVNSKGQIIGGSADAQFENFRGVLWERDGHAVDLNSLVQGSNLLLSTPANINNKGEIAGIGTDSNGNEHVFVLIPCVAEDGPDCRGG
jgi:probable HAF family extracellular repeat protein